MAVALLRRMSGRQGDNLALLFVCCERLADTLSLECAVQVVLL